MRISDWSSDVCSSDLPGAGAAAAGDGERQAAVAPGPRLRASAGLGHRRSGDAGDRKSVVSGKSVSVRVDLGGRRIIKKKTTNQNICHHEANMTTRPHHIYKERL